MSKVSSISENKTRENNEEPRLIRKIQFLKLSEYYSGRNQRKTAHFPINKARALDGIVGSKDFIKTYLK